jgi:Tol biopolymer transport system component
MTIGGRPVVVYAGFDGTVEPLALGDIVPQKGMTMTPDGTKVAWSTCHAEENLAFLATGTDGKPRLDNVPAGEWVDRDPAPVPGTSQIVLVSERTGDPELWVVDVRGALPARKLPSDSVRATGVAVSPDRQWVVYSGGGTDAAGEGLIALAFDGQSPPRPLTTLFADSSPAISADGYVYFDRQIAADRWDVMRVPLAGGDAETVIEAADSPKISEDGRLLLFQKAGKPTVRDLRTGKDRLLSRHVEGQAYYDAAFSADGRRVAIISNNKLMLFDRASGDVLLTYESGTEQLTAVAFAGDQLVLGRLRWEGDLWMIDTEVSR